jgi:hypothetical protein
MREYIIVGSEAAIHHKIIPERRKLDTDIFATDVGITEWMEDNLFYFKEFQDTEKGVIYWSTDGRILEVESTRNCDNIKAIYERMTQATTDIYAPPAWLYFLKMSHRFKKDSPHFLKTMHDIQAMRNADVGMPVGSEALFKERERLTYNYGHPKLNVKKDNFFKGDEVPYQYDHDSIHRVVAVDGPPAYTKYIQDGAQVMCSKEKFFAVDHRVRLLGGLEEALVLTAERSLIPNNFKPNPHQMFEFALQKVCTSITSGWFREWCWDHYYEIVRLYQKEVALTWVKKLRRGIDSGEVLPYNPNSTY